ncbi:MAG: family 20 glycosylhydrolase [Rhodoglobus sp.]|nr:family 20 glycosylhydrolase [Rhodoglobus sp.]
MKIDVVPRPVQVDLSHGSFPVADGSVTGPLAAYAAEVLGMRVVESGATVNLVLGETPTPGGHTIEIVPTGIRVEADATAGLFAAIQTLRQLATRTPGALPCLRIEDHPRFAYRGAMLDVARHFFSVADVKRYIDDIALLKLNYLHLHLTDDQGWRLEILSRPDLTRRGATTQVGGANGRTGLFYSQDDYREIVAYAVSRFVTIVPEIDIPGHTNAAIVAYPELGETATEPYEGIEVGFSSLAIASEETYAFVEDVLREVAALTPGPYLHLGGDESLATSDTDFLLFIARVTSIAAKFGKTLIGWHEMGRSPDLPAGTVGQYWSFTTPQEGAAEHTLSFVQQGGAVILSPADVAYLDIKYDADAELGLLWANGPTSLEESYRWEPTEIIPGLHESEILGIEAPIWTETITTLDQLQFMAFPRLAAVAELAWSPRGDRSFDEFAPRLSALARLWDATGTNYFRAPGVDWPS